MQICVQQEETTTTKPHVFPNQTRNKKNDKKPDQAVKRELVPVA